MKKLNLKDISEMKVFEKFGDTFTQVRHNPKTGWYLYLRQSREASDHYEVVRGVKTKNPDGSIVYRYPSSENWGQYGYTISKTPAGDKMVEFIMSAKSRSAEEIYEFKKTLRNTLYLV